MRIRFSILLIVLLMLCGCQERKTVGTYQVTCELRPPVARDSVMLLVYEPDYGRLRELGWAKNADGEFVLKGEIDEPHRALLKFGTDSSALVFNFILEPTDIRIAIGEGSWRIDGGRENREYMRVLNDFQRMEQDRKKLWQRYSSHAADSTLTEKMERELFLADSLLADSMQNRVVDFVNRGTMAGQLVKQRLIHSLKAENLKKLRK